MVMSVDRVLAAVLFGPGCSSSVELFGLLPSLDIGGPEARLRSAFRILVRSAFESVATSLWQSGCSI